MIGFFPLFALILIAFNVVVFGGDVLFGAEAGQDVFNSTVASFQLMSSDVWKITLGDTFVIVSLLILFLEIVKATRTNQVAIMNHALSMLVFIVALVEFIVMEGFGNSTFFLIMAMSMLDVIAGFTITISTARRDLGIGQGIFAG
ncbi:MAG: hypothetical protein E2O89_03810 [Alphaproteobacteria bacterium]|nr:MAG: hypothetical protein E2O89_03810 [Alphaproteobacteria bacterium]